MSLFVSEGYVEEQNFYLTPREHDVLKLLAMGHSRAEVGDRLGITVETVKSHARKVRLKLNARTTAHAVALAMSYDLI